MKRPFHHNLMIFFLPLIFFISPSLTLRDHPVHLANEDGKDRKELKILSWNIYMLPALVKFTGKIKRAKGIVKALRKQDYHIIVFQEAFHKRARKIIQKGLREIYPHAYGPANQKWFSLKANSGIWILSKIPLEVLGTIRFDECTDIDCWSRKGAMLAKGDWNGQPFQILGTHLQASGPDSIRHSQYRQIKNELLAPYQKKGVPQIMCGDFNTAQEDQHNYERMLSILDARHGKLHSEMKHSINGFQNDFLDNTRQNLIDFLFYRDNESGQPQKLERFIKVFRHEWDQDNHDLSDHYAIEARIIF